MPPNLEVQISDEEIQSTDDQITIILSPISDFGISTLSDIHINEQPFIEFNVDSLFHEGLLQIPLEQNLRDLLVQVTNTEDLTTVTQLKLRVISRETTLQYLSIYTPALRELILDGSLISSLRDLGFGLKNLKILKVNRCGLKCIDGVFGFENLEGLYAADNEISALAPCAFLTSIRVLDMRRNMVTQNEINFLKYCNKVDELFVEGNPGIYLTPSFRQIVKQTLPNIKILDGFILNLEGSVSDSINEEDLFNSTQTGFNGNIFNQEERTNFSIDFPPRIFLQRFNY